MFKKKLKEALRTEGISIVSSSSNNNFAIKLSQTLSESVLDWPRDTLAPEVWDKEDGVYILKPHVRSEILTMISRIPRHMVDNVHLIGSICTYNYNDKSDLDVHIMPPDNIPIEELEKWQEYAKEYSGKLVGEHPINYYFHDPGHDYHADSIYDTMSNKWVKWAPIEKIDLGKYYEKFRKVVDTIDINKAEIYRDIVDLEELRDAYDKASPKVQNQIEREIDDKINEVNIEIDDYIDQYLELRDKRLEVLGTDFPGEKSRSELPDNVVFLLLRRYGYTSLAKAFKEIKKESGEIDSPAEIDRIKKAFYEPE